MEQRRVSGNRGIYKPTMGLRGANVHNHLPESGSFPFSQDQKREAWRDGLAAKSTASLLEDLGSIPKTYMMTQNHLTSVPGRYNALFWTGIRHTGSMKMC